MLSGKHYRGDFMFRVIVAGGRDFNDYELLKSKLDSLLVNKSNIVIISGTANGADSLGERYAKERSLQLERMPAEWHKYGKMAGFMRNTEMARVADACVVFWDGKSKGTKHMIDTAERLKLELRIIKY